ncbi:trehalase family glycosidase [Riemerella anatipestifer]|nr:trehalase family glycosidase [Riemerella anatipestifer]MDY3533568.1 trehalase family glycosidase [Riemerella anatipestifer]MDY3535973.1 trehalase family glycosidase [Riemerella anatipestifer]
MLHYIDSISDIFHAVQSQDIFKDQKTMADAIPLMPIEEINAAYLSSKDSKDFNLKEFVTKYFRLDMPVVFEVETSSHSLLPIEHHIEQLWTKLERSTIENTGTRIKLPNTYVVPGGRFNEFFYWDSYYIMLGLEEYGKKDMILNMLDNAAHLISEYGFVPNGNRTYFLGRSQPPYFSLMLQLYAKLESNENDLLIKYLKVLEKEYKFWMKGENEDFETHFLRLTKMPNGELLNRYYDNYDTPRPESYMIDLKEAQNIDNKSNFYRNIRAACESGWDFSSRWLEDSKDLKSIYTLDLVTPDLNALLWNTENLLSEIYLLINDKEKSEEYSIRAENRKKAIHKYLWSDEFKTYGDYHITKQKIVNTNHLGIAYPLFIGLASQSQAECTKDIIENKFLYKGGLVTTTNSSGQQWDSPNAWAPLQWIACKGLMNYGYYQTAKEIAQKWCSNVESTYKKTGKLMEKYDAINTENIATGGEYPNQDGFGWTNAIYIKMKKIFNL